MLRACHKTRGYIPSYPPKSEAISAILKWPLRFLLLLLLAPASALLLAQELAPDAMLQSATLEVVAALKHERDVNAGNAVQVASVVETKVLPLFDFNRMTRSAMARNWRLATPLQQTALVAEFKTLLVRTYSAALANYHGQTIEFRRLAMTPSDTEITVKSVVKQAGTAPESMDYDMEKTPAGWKVYDIKVAGVSLITTYRDTFSVAVRDDGVDGLIKLLADKNRQGDVRPAKRKT